MVYFDSRYPVLDNLLPLFVVISFIVSITMAFAIGHVSL